MDRDINAAMNMLFLLKWELEQGADPIPITFQRQHTQTHVISLKKAKSLVKRTEIKHWFYHLTMPNIHIHRRII